MKRFLGAILAILFLSSQGSPARSDESDPKAILDKAIRALGGEEKLQKAEMATWKVKETITFNENNQLKMQATVQGLDRYRSEYQGEFNGKAIKGVNVLNGNKGWRKVNDTKTEFDERAVAKMKRFESWHLSPPRLLPLKDQGVRIAPGGEQRVNRGPAVGIKATGLDSTDLTLYLDRQSGLPVMLVAKILGPGDDEFPREMTYIYSDYKDFDGIKRPTKIEAKRNGKDFWKAEVTEFKVLDKVDSKTFAEPE
jgi:hypothetical protein